MDDNAFQVSFLLLGINIVNCIGCCQKGMFCAEPLTSHILLLHCYISWLNYKKRDSDSLVGLLGIARISVVVFYELCLVFKWGSHLQKNI